MLGIVCQICAKRPASAHLTELGPSGRQEAELHICANCIDRLELDLATSPIPIAEILLKKQLSEMVSDDTETPTLSVAVDPDDDPICPVCGLAQSAFAQTNRFGCAQCYRTFGDLVEGMLVRYHGTATHQGRRPMQENDAADALLERTRLDAELKQALASENFELAAQVRDQLRTLDRTDG